MLNALDRPRPELVVRFRIEASALNGDEAALNCIDQLVDRLADEVHLIEVPDVDLLEDSAWYQNARASRRKVLTTALARPPRAQANPREPLSRVESVHDGDSARLATRLAYTPLTLLVEDREADGVLLEMLIEELAWPALKGLWLRGQRASPPASKLESAGGINAIPDRIDRAISDAAQENRAVRLFVLCDSDTRWPGEQDTPATKSVARVLLHCTKCGVPLHILKKRTAENYIPDQVFEDKRDAPGSQSRVARFNLFLSLTSTQRDHFPIKDGMSDEERRAAIASKLYSRSDDPTLRQLADRLFDKRPRVLKQVQRNYRSSVTGPGLQRRDGAGEIEDLLRKIAKEL